MKTLFFLAALLCSLSALAQDDFAVIKDPDGFVNVRAAGVQSKVVGKILQHQIFDCIAAEETSAPEYPNMVYVDFNKYAKQKDGYLRNNRNDTSIYSGYIHKSRVQKLSQLPQLPLKHLSENEASFANDTMRVSIITAKFQSEKHVMRDTDGKQLKQTNAYSANGSIASIDGLDVWGADGGVPRTEIQAIEVWIKGTKWSFPESAIKNIFDPNVDAPYTQVFFGLEGELYIWMQNSDGAGSYNVIWTIANGKLTCIFTGISTYA